MYGLLYRHQLATCQAVRLGSKQIRPEGAQGGEGTKKRAHMLSLADNMEFRHGSHLVRPYSLWLLVKEGGEER